LFWFRLTCLIEWGLFLSCVCLETERRKCCECWKMADGSSSELTYTFRLVGITPKVLSVAFEAVSIFFESQPAFVLEEVLFYF